MLTVRELISRIRIPINRGAPSNTSISKRYIYNIAKTVRSKILYEQERNPKWKKEAFMQTIDCVKLKEIDWNECNLKPKSGYVLLRSENPIPTPINGNLENVYTTNLVKYNKTSIDKLSIKQDIWNFLKSNESYFLKNNKDGMYLYLVSKENPKWLIIDGLFSDEEEVKNYCKEECTSILDTIFYIDERLIDLVIKLILEEIFKSYQQGVKDIKSDGIDETGKTTKG